MTEQKKWNKKWWGIMIQVLIWPLGLFMMWKNSYFSQTVRIIISLILVGLVINGLTKKPTKSGPKGEYSVGNSYSYFSSNGSVSFYNKSSSGLQSCKTDGGIWKKEGENIYVSGLYSSNCPFMSKFNGKYLIDGRRALPR